MVAAGLKGDVGRGAPGISTGWERLKGSRFGVGTADGGMPTGREDVAILDQDTADPGVGCCADVAPTRQREGLGHPFPVPGGDL